jgi:hypothetical protein
MCPGCTGREVFFWVVLTDPARFEFKEPYRLEQYIPFLRPLPFSADSIIKLSQALAYADEIVVSRGHVVGIRRAAPAWWRLYTQLGMFAPAATFPIHGWRPAIAVRNEGPGQLYVFADERPIGALHSGIVFSPPEAACPARDLFGSTDAELRSEFGEWLEVRCSRLLLDILARVARRRHGGSVLVVGRGEDGRVPDGIKLKYEVRWTALWDKIREVCANAAAIANFANTPVVDQETGESRYPRPGNSPTYDALQATLDQSADAVEHEIRFLAALSAVDGAIVITDRFELLGFGAELIVGDSPGGDILLHGHDWSAEPQQRRMDDSGMRHRSMYKYVAAHPAARGFVVSQDGAVKGVQYFNDLVHVWAHLGSQ